MATIRGVIIARKDVVLAEHAEGGDRLSQFVSGYLRQAKMSYSKPIHSAQGEYDSLFRPDLFSFFCLGLFSVRYIHICLKPGIIFLTVVDNNYKVRLANLFLEEIKKEFEKSYKPAEIANAPPETFNYFWRTLKKIMVRKTKAGWIVGGNQEDFIESPEKYDLISQAAQKLETVQETQIQNLGIKKGMAENWNGHYGGSLEALLSREEKLDDLVRKTSNMSSMATNIRKTATAVKNKTWWELWKLKILMIAIVAVVQTCPCGFQWEFG